MHVQSSERLAWRCGIFINFPGVTFSHSRVPSRRLSPLGRFRRGGYGLGRPHENQKGSACVSAWPGAKRKAAARPVLVARGHTVPTLRVVFDPSRSSPHVAYQRRRCRLVEKPSGFVRPVHRSASFPSRVGCWRRRCSPFSDYAGPLHPKYSVCRPDCEYVGWYSPTYLPYPPAYSLKGPCGAPVFHPFSGVNISGA
ncbi:unnamed protein product [Amoebophrya sp. A120]|nr:unnamed protein product [Amoebophrya sp. A120]|eukprot:GSA120T00015643001.1